MLVTVARAGQYTVYVVIPQYFDKTILIPFTFFNTAIPKLAIYHQNYCISFTSGNHTPGSRSYSDIVDTYTGFVKTVLFQ